MKIKLFQKCEECEKTRRLNQFQDLFNGQKLKTCKICDAKHFAEAMDALHDWQTEEAEKQDKNIKEVFAELKEMVCEDFLKDIRDCIEECEGGHNFKIVDKPLGDSQEEGYDYIKHIYVDQSCGVCGDDYYGEVYIPLPNNKYLQFSYEC